MRKKENLINFFIESGNPGDQEKMNFESYLVTLESAKMEYQVYFENPKMISMGSQENKDQMKIQLSLKLIESLKSRDSQNLPLDLSNYDHNLVISKGLPC